MEEMSVNEGDPKMFKKKQKNNNKTVHPEISYADNVDFQLRIYYGR